MNTTKCDLWSIGIIIYRLLFKEFPYPGLTENEILDKIKKIETDNLKKTKNKELDNLIQRLLEKNPQNRLDWDEYLNHSFFNQSKEEDNKKLKEYTDILEVVLLGESYANKTELIKQFCRISPDNLLQSFFSKTVRYPEFNKLIRFDLFDTPGQERFRPVAKFTLKIAKVIIFVYDITSYHSFEEIKYWYNEVKNIYGEKMPILAVVGNNYDKYEDQQVSDDEGLQFAYEIGAIFQLTSKKCDSNELFDNIGKKYFDPNFDFKKKEEKTKEAYLKAKALKKLNKHKSDEPKSDKSKSDKSLKKGCIII